MPSFYSKFNENDIEHEITEPESHHITRVFRHKIGDLISLINGKGLLANGQILEIYKKSIKVRLSDFTFTPPIIGKISCAFSLLKNKHDLLIVEKLTELGVNDLFPLISTNSVKLSKENTLEKMILTSIAAAKQCNNPWLPEINPVLYLAQGLDFIKRKNYIPLVASEVEREKKLSFILQNSKFIDKNICIIIGPEGGFTKEEFALFNENNIEQFSLGKNILKAETAAICAISQIIYNIP